MRLLDRYLIREIAPYIALCLLLLTAVIFLREANRFSELFIVFSRNGLPTGPLFNLILAVIPSILLYTVPISLLVGVLTGLGRLSADSEITAMRASGISRRRLMYPLLVVGIAAAAVMTYITFTLAPESQRTLSSLKEARGDIIYQGIATKIKPRVFEESIPGKVFFIQDIDRHTNEWKNLFIADIPKGDNPDELRVYTARSGRLAVPKAGEILPEFHLSEAQSHQARNFEERNRLEYDIQQSERLSIIFSSPGALETAEEAVASRVSYSEMDLATLLAHEPDPPGDPAYTSEVHRRFAIPVTCIIFAVIGLAFGVYNQRAGRSHGLLLGLVLTTIFYVLSLGGEKSARSGSLPAWLGIWGPNLAFALFAVWINLRGRLPRWAQFGSLIIELVQRIQRSRSGGSGRSAVRGGSTLGFPRLLDRLIFSDLVRHVLFVTAGMTLLFLVFTVFELISEIVRNSVPFSLVFAYVLYLAPQIVNYLLPLAVLVGVMVTFGLMASGSQIIAMKASGLSIYRMAIPVFLLAAMTAAGLYGLQNYVLPTTNRQQDDLRQQIQSGTEPARTVYQTDRQWVFSRDNRIFYYRHFDPVTDTFASLSIFDLDPETFQIKRRIWAATGRWDAATNTWLLEYGWLRTFDGIQITSADAFRQQRLSISETPANFKHKVSHADTLSFSDLRAQIAELSRSGFDVLDLRIDFQSKIAFPITCIVMALVGLSFAFSVGRRGAVVGVAVGLAIGLVFWGALGLFTQMGRYELLPPVLAAWGPNLIFGAAGAYMFLTTRT